LARLFQKTIGAADPNAVLIPISVCGATMISSPEGSIDLALDPTDFNTNQFFTFNATVSPQILPIGSDKTILWCRQPPLTGLPQTITLSVWTEIDYAGDY